MSKFEGTFGYVSHTYKIYLVRSFCCNLTYLFSSLYSYFAPEYFMHGIVDEKIDVYSYGVLVLEIVTGRQVIDDSQKSIVMWVC